MVPENQRYTSAQHTQTKPSPLNTCISATKAREDYFAHVAECAFSSKMNTLPAIDSLDGETQDLSHYQACYDTTSPDTSFAASNDDEFSQTVSNYEVEPKADDPTCSSVQKNQDSDDYNSRNKIKQPKTLRPLAPARDALPGRWTIHNSPPMADLSLYQPFPTNDNMNWMPGSYQFPGHQLGTDPSSAIHHPYNMAQPQGSYTIPYSDGFTSPVMSVTAPMNNVVVIPNYSIQHQDMGRCDSASPGPHDGINIVPQHIFSSQVMYTSHPTYGTQDDGSVDHRQMLLPCGAPGKSASIPVAAQNTFFTDHIPYSSSVPGHLSDEIMIMQSQVPIIRGRITNADRAKKRRETHNAIERRRRDQINERIAELSTLIPQCQEVIMQTTSLSSAAAAIASAISDGPETQDASILSSMNKGEQNHELPTPDCGPECVLTTTTIVSTVNILSASGASSGPLVCVCLQHSRPAILPQPGSDAQSSLIRLNKTFILEKSVEYIRQLQEAVKRQAILLRRTSGIIPRAALEDLGRDLMEDNSNAMNMPNVCSQSPNQGLDDGDIF